MVLGAGGMAGHVITLHLRAMTKLFNVIAVSRSNNMISPDILADVTDLPALDKLLHDQKPDVIINCIGSLNAVAENDPSNAILVNSYLPHYLAAYTKKSGSKLIHISTDCVFSGSKGAYTETDLPDGQGYYARTKALGEIINEKDITIRTSIIGPELNAKGIGLFNWFAGQKGTVNGYTEAYWTGITTWELAKAIPVIIDEDISGLYHLVSEEKISKFSLLEIFRQTFPKSKLSDISPSDTYCSDKSLLNTRTDHTLKMPAYPEMITDMKEQILAHRELYPHYADII
ncbi:MAG: SDR family oxidoreductase [Ferruginibacter sp.]